MEDGGTEALLMMVVVVKKRRMRLMRVMEGIKDGMMKSLRFCRVKVFNGLSTVGD